MSRSYYSRKKIRTYRFRKTKEQEDSILHMAVKQILDFLYADQVVHWNAQIGKLSAKNADYYGRKEEYAVHFQGKRYRPIAIMESEQQELETCLPLHPEHPELFEEMRLVADQLHQLEKERTEAKRFISGLFQLGVTEDQFVEILGENLLSAVPGSIMGGLLATTSPPMEAQKQSIDRYIQENQDIIDTLGERRLINILVK